MKTIALTKGQKTTIDDFYFDFLSERTWQATYSRFTKSYYATGRIRVTPGPRGRRMDRIHWYPLGRPMKGFQIDHINGDTLDNRRENLRIISVRENQQNQKKHRSGKLAGVGFHKRDRRWRAFIKIDGKAVHLVNFDTEKEAHAAYVQALDRTLRWNQPARINKN